MPHQPYVYLCFAREDRAVAETVCRALEGAGIHCWMAPRDILPGTDWEASINQAIEDSSVVIPLISSHFDENRKVQREFIRARDMNKAIIPLRVEDILPTGALRYLLISFQSVDAFDPPLEPNLAPLIRRVTRTIEMVEENWTNPVVGSGLNESSPSGGSPSHKSAFTSLGPGVPAAQSPSSSAPPPAQITRETLFSRERRPAPSPPPPMPVSGQMHAPSERSPGPSSFQPSQWLRRALEKLTPTRRAPAKSNAPIAAAAPSATTPVVTTTAASPQVPEDRIDRVHFSVSAPRSVQRGAAFVVAIWAHLGHQHKELLERIRETSAPGTSLVGSKGPVQVSRGAVLSAHLHIDGMSIPFPSDTILWEGEIGNASFPVTAPDDAGEGSHPGTATLYVNQIQIARIHFVLEVGSPALQMEDTPHSIKFFHSGFASYASPDRDEVLGRIQGMQKIAPDLNIFLDVASLHSGADWENKLWHAISKSDVFYLFWSAAAKASPWVEREWRCALTTKGVDFIDPVPLVSPDEVAPPEELSGKHFNDWILAFRRSPAAKNRPQPN